MKEWFTREISVLREKFTKEIEIQHAAKMKLLPSVSFVKNSDSSSTV